MIAVPSGAGASAARETTPQALIEAILADEQPATALLRTLEMLDARHELPTQAVVFEALVWRLDRLEYWVWYRMSRVYADLGRAEAGAACAVQAVRIHPEWEASFLPYRDLYRHFQASGNAVAAASVLLQQRRFRPDQPIAPPEEMQAALRAGGIDPARALPAHAPGAAEAVLDPLAAVMRETFRQPQLSVRMETTAEDVPGWDSLSHAVLLMNVERAFGIVFEPADILDLPTVGALASLIARKTRAATAARRKLIVYGNCQAGALAVVLRNTRAIADRYDIVTHDLWATGEELRRNLADFADAAILLRQDVSNWRQHPLRDRLPPELRVVSFPFCYVAALWPFDAMVAGADEKMLRVMRAEQGAGREFPFGFQDGLLARLRDSVADPEDRFRRYRDLDLPDAPDLARFAELEEQRLLRDDERLGCTIGRYIVENYRRIRLFHAIAHPTAGLIGRLAGEVAGKAGLDPGASGLATYDDYMGHYQVPLHPAVIRALGIAWADETTRYDFHRRERLTFEEYYRRYIAVPVGD